MHENGVCGVYIMTDPTHNVLYVGMSTDLPARINVHREKIVAGFTKRYNCIKLVYFESQPDKDSAYLRERQIKGWSRKKKTDLIYSRNPDWVDLFEELINSVVT